MSYKWTKQSIRWFAEASEYTNFHKNLADKISPYLKKEYTLCDVGCGLGRLDIFLAPYVSQITAIDSEKYVIDELNKKAGDMNISNINAVCADARKCANPHDIFIMSFFGHNGEMESYFQQCRKKLIRIANASDTGTFYPKIYSRKNKSTIPIIEKQLKEQGITYRLLTETIEFGQPLRSEDDAKNFVIYNAPDASSHEINQFLNVHAQNTGKRDFPIYIPNRKQIGIFIVNMEEEK